MRCSASQTNPFGSTLTIPSCTVSILDKTTKQSEQHYQEKNQLFVGQTPCSWHERRPSVTKQSATPHASRRRGDSGAKSERVVSRVEPMVVQVMTKSPFTNVPVVHGSNHCTCKLERNNQIQSETQIMHPEKLDSLAIGTDKVS